LEAELDLVEGLRGDGWRTRGSRETADGSAHPEMQLTLMNARAAELVAGDKDRRALAGDQLYLDLDLSIDNLPPGMRLAIGSAVIEITAPPHTGCRSFTNRFGSDATRFVNSREGKRLRLRGANAKVVQAGIVRWGDRAWKTAALGLLPQKGKELASPP
jgi:MOSC domain-containing protein YiiM